MPFIEWSSDFSVKVESMDQQHKRLVKLINDLHSAMKSRRGKDMVGVTMRELVDYTRTHFTAEERYLQSIGYPALQEQQIAHRAFVSKIEDYQKKLDAGGGLPLNDVLNFVWGWLKTHIQKEDRKYGEYAMARSPQATRV